MLNKISWRYLSHPSFLIVVSFFLWIICFWPFLCGKVPLSSDAVSYYDHIRFFLESLSRGSFPLWDPHWSGGVPNDFFLRRIGPYNPFFIVPIFLTKVGMDFFFAYMIFHVLYFFLGMIAFYCLAQKLLKDRLSAFVAFLVLMFSVLGTRMFDSYMLLITVPVIFFFYFMVSFFCKPIPLYMVGMTLAGMLLLTTYIPLYFVVILLFFLVVYAIVCWQDLPLRWCTLRVFVCNHFFIFIFCLGALVVAALPVLSFFSDAGQGTISLPGRNGSTQLTHPLLVESQQLNPWSIMEEFFFSSYYTDMRRMAFAIVYVPLVSFLILLAGLAVRFSRLFLILFFWGVLLVLFSMPIGFPLYNVMYRLLGFIKYFRNLHFLLWFALLPIYALFVGEVWRAFYSQRVSWPRWVSALWVLIVHVIVFIALFLQGDALVSTWLAWGASGILFVLLFVKNVPVKGYVFPLIFLTMVIQPVEVFSYFSRNYADAPRDYFYEHIGQTFSHLTIGKEEGRIPLLANAAPPLATGGALYYATGVYQSLRSSVDGGDLERYESYKFYLYDHETPADNLTNAFSGQPVKEDSALFRVTHFTPNKVIIHTSLPVKKFVVYNDAYHAQWQLRVNGKKESLHVANGAFKGFWLPAGESIAVLSFGSWRQYLLNGVLFLLFYGMAGWLVCFWLRKGAHAHS